MHFASSLPLHLPLHLQPSGKHFHLPPHLQPSDSCYATPSAHRNRSTKTPGSIRIKITITILLNFSSGVPGSLRYANHARPFLGARQRHWGGASVCRREGQLYVPPRYPRGSDFDVVLINFIICPNNIFVASFIWKARS